MFTSVKLTLVTVRIESFIRRPKAYVAISTIAQASELAPRSTSFERLQHLEPTFNSSQSMHRAFRYLFYFDFFFRDKDVPLPSMLRDESCCPCALSHLRVEKIEGGLMVAGVVVAANCQIILPIFGFLFLLIGTVLTGKLIFIFRIKQTLRKILQCTKLPCYQLEFSSQPV